MAYGHDTGRRHDGDFGQVGRLRIARHGACIVFQSTNRLQPSKRRAGLVQCRPDVWETSLSDKESVGVSPADARDTAWFERLAQQGKNPPYCARLITPSPSRGLWGSAM
jgi:hypothetical protein